MDRRKFIGILSLAPITIAVVGCGRREDYELFDSPSKQIASGFKSFGYYEGLSPNQMRSPSRNDGTYHNMPCISEADIAAGVAKTYKFWHGHGQDHTFTLTEDHFKQLALGQRIEVYTSVVGGHRHALRITPSEICRA